MLITMAMSYQTMASPLHYGDADCTIGYLPMIEYASIPKQLPGTGHVFIIILIIIVLARAF